MTVAAYAELPEEITVRELRYRVHTPGFRVSEVTLVSPLTTPAMNSGTGHLEAPNFPGDRLPRGRIRPEPNPSLNSLQEL